MDKINELLTRSVAEIIERDSLEKKLKENKKLRVKFGIDPTWPDIHIGHAVVIRKLKAFQEAGHQIVFIVGDYTARIGDPSGLDQARKSLSAEQVKENAATYFDQAFKILDREKTEVHNQSEWFAEFDLAKILELTSKISVNQLIEHETFKKRLLTKKPLMFHEALYPLLQGYDSVAIKADLEIGGQDQKFNLLMGRQIQKAYHQSPQDVMMTKYLLGIDGRQKMSKSLGNYIAINDPPYQMYGKIMSIPDNQILSYFELATDLTTQGLEVVKKELESGKVNPRDIKARLAKLITETYWGSVEAEEAQIEFDRVFSQKQMPKNIKEIKLPSKEYLLSDLLVTANLVSSKSEAKRLILGGGVKINQEKITSPQIKINLDKAINLQIGKLKFAKILPK